MKTKTLLQTLLAAGAVSLLAGQATASPYAYNSRDLQLVFRKTGSPDLEVNLGSVTNFVNLPPGTVLNVGQYSAAQFQNAFGTDATNSQNVNFVGMAAVSASTGDATYPDNTLWLTAPRATAGTQTAPWLRKPNSNQSGVAGKVRGVAGDNAINGAKTWSAGTPADAVTNAHPVVIIPSSGPDSYTAIAGTGGKLGNTFQGVIENTTPGSSFTVARSDLYQMKPSTTNGNGDYLGYFEFNSDGTMKFVRDWSGSYSQSVTAVSTGNTTISLPSATNIFTNMVVVGAPAHGSLSGSGYSRTYTPNTGILGGVRPDSFTYVLTDGVSTSGVFTVSLVAPYKFDSKDVMLAFRKTGSPDLEANLGPIVNFINLPPGAEVTLDHYSPAQFQNAFGTGTNNSFDLSLAAMASVFTATGDAAYPDNTLWLTRPRATVGSQTAPWLRKPNSNQAGVGGKVRGIGGNNAINGAKSWSAGTALDAVTNAEPVVIIPSGGPDSYTSIAGTGGKLGDTFQGVVENATPTNSYTVVQSDLYQLKPSSTNGNGDYLGYFEFSSSGVTKFVRAGSLTGWSGDLNSLSQTIPLVESNAVPISLGTDPNRSAVILTGPAHGTLTPVSGLTYTFTPTDANFNGLDSFTYVLTDGGSTSSVFTVNIPVAAVNDVFPYNFAGAVNYSVGSGPAAVAIAKINADTALDAVTVNYSNNTASILLGNGKGQFTNTLSAAVGNGPSAVLAVDLNADKKTDLLVANKTDSTVSFLPGNNDGTFGAAVDLSTGISSPGALALFGTKPLVLAVANEGNGTVTTYTNNSGTFTQIGSAYSLGAGANPASVVAADANKDGKLDIVVANYGSNTLSVLRARATNALLFDLVTNITVGLNPNAVIAADFNNDKKTDFAVANYGDDTVTVLLNTTTNATNLTFTSATYPVGVNPSALAAADLDKNGVLDIVVANYFDNEVYVLRGNATTNGTFPTSYYYGDPSVSTAVGTNPVALAVADLNADALPDAVVANFGSANVSVLLNAYTPKAFGQIITLREGDSTNLVLTATPGEMTYNILQAPTNGSLTGTLPNVTYATTDTNFFGKDTIKFNVSDGVKTSALAIVSLTILPVNDQPVFNLASSLLVVNEDAPKQYFTNFATNVVLGPANESKDKAKFIVSNNHSNLFSMQPAISGTNFILAYTPKLNQNGSALVTVILNDGGKTLNGGIDQSTNTFTIQVNAVDDKPVIAKLAFSKMNEDTTLTNVFTVTDVDTTAGTHTFTVTTDNSTLFPDVSTNFVFTPVGTNLAGVIVTNRLVITPAAEQFGTSVVVVAVSDGTNTVNLTNTLGVAAVNDRPSFTIATPPGDVSIGKTLGALSGFSQAGWATGISAGPANESAQTLTFVVKAANAGLFNTTGVPAITSAGTLTFTNKSTLAILPTNTTVTVYLKDSASGYASHTNTFTITITSP